MPLRAFIAALVFVVALAPARAADTLAYSESFDTLFRVDLTAHTATKIGQATPTGVTRFANIEGSDADPRRNAVRRLRRQRREDAAAHRPGDRPCHADRRAHSDRWRHRRPARSRHGGDLRRKTLAVSSRHRPVLADRSEYRRGDAGRQSRRQDHRPGRARQSGLRRGKPGQQQLLHDQHQHRRGVADRQLRHVRPTSRPTSPGFDAERPVCGPCSTTFRRRRARIRSPNGAIWRRSTSGTGALTNTGPITGDADFQTNFYGSLKGLAIASSCTAAVAATSQLPTLSWPALGLLILLVGGFAAVQFSRRYPVGLISLRCSSARGAHSPEDLSCGDC